MHPLNYCNSSLKQMKIFVPNENYQSFLSAKRICVALAGVKEKVVELEDSPRKSEFLQKLDSILSKLREYYQFHQRYRSGAEALDNPAF